MYSFALLSTVALASLSLVNAAPLATGNIHASSTQPTAASAFPPLYPVANSTMPMAAFSSGGSAKQKRDINSSPVAISSTSSSSSIMPASTASSLRAANGSQPFEMQRVGGLSNSTLTTPLKRAVAPFPTGSTSSTLDVSSVVPQTYPLANGTSNDVGVSLDTNGSSAA